MSLMIRKSLKQLIRWANTYHERDQDSDNFITTMTGPGINSNGLNFTLYGASGGYVLEYRQYDRKTDRPNNALYIINNVDDLGEKIGEIITLELLRN
jgi:hypothetical protein